MGMLQVGDRVPNFSATTPDGQAIRLSDFLGQRALVVFFYPKVGTPVCTREVCSFRDSYEKFLAAGADIIGISSDPNPAHRQFAEQHRVPFKLLSDADGSLHKAFGLKKTLGLIPRRVTFVIDKEGIVRLVFSALFASDEHVQQSLQAVAPAHLEGSQGER